MESTSNERGGLGWGVYEEEGTSSVFHRGWGIVREGGEVW